MNSVVVLQGGCADIPIQTFLRGSFGGNRVPAAYPNGSIDVLSGNVFWGTTLTPLFTPTVTWYGAPGLNGIATQTGYDQGQVLVSMTNAQAAMLVATSKYILTVWWNPALAPTKNIPIVRMKLVVQGSQLWS